jgi:creatinine amidohydrolase
MKLMTSTWVEVDEYLKTKSGIIIPIGSVEQHGSRGLLGTDTITSETICNKINEKFDIIIGPTLSIGIAQYHMNFSGTITLRPSTLISIIHDVVSSLYKHGFTHIYFINGHGGNIPTIEAAFDEYYSTFSLNKEVKDSFAKCKLSTLWQTEAYHKLEKKYFDGVEGNHVTPGEISIADFAYPQYIHDNKMKPDVAPAFDTLFDSNDYRKRYPDGRMGSNPNLATVEIGKEIVYSVVDEILEDYTKFLES